MSLRQLGAGTHLDMETTGSFLRVLTDDPGHWPGCITSFLTTRPALTSAGNDAQTARMPEMCLPPARTTLNDVELFGTGTSAATDERLRLSPLGTVEALVFSREKTRSSASGRDRGSQLLGRRPTRTANAFRLWPGFRS